MTTSKRDALKCTFCFVSKQIHKLHIFTKFDRVHLMYMSCRRIVAIAACLQLFCHHCFTLENVGLVIRDVTFIWFPWRCVTVKVTQHSSQGNVCVRLAKYVFFVSQSLFREKIKRSEVAFYGATKTTHCSQTVSYLDKEKKPVDLKKKSILYCIDAWEIWMHNCLCFSFQEVPW